MKKLSDLWGRNKKKAPAGESPVLAAHGDFPAGVRVAIVDIADTATRCSACGWTYAKVIGEGALGSSFARAASEGCVPGNCSQRPMPEAFYDPKRYEAEYARMLSGVPANITKWEVIYHQPEKSFTLRHLGDEDAKSGPAFILEEDHIADIVVQKGMLLHPKTLEQLKGGAWLDTLHPGTYFSALDLESPKDKNGSPSSYYILRYSELITYMLQSVAPLMESSHALEAGTNHGSSDGDRAGEQPAGGGAGAGEGQPPSAPSGQDGGVDQP